MTNVELSASLNMVLARLDADPKTAGEWETIEGALRKATAEAHRRLLACPPGDPFRTFGK
jgi:hypothetical protein